MNSRRLTFFALAALTVVYGCSPVGVINRLTPSDTYVRTAAIAYGARPRQRLDIYQPGDRPSHAPVVVFFYGGSWSSASREDYLFVGEALASRGIVTVIADYRLYPEVRYPEFLTDRARAVAWTIREISTYGGDPHRIFVSGHSAGAYNAAMLALDPRWLRRQGVSSRDLAGFIGLAGPYDFLPITDVDIRPIFNAPDTPADSQPMNHVTPDAPPALLLAATQDRFVFPDRNTKVLAARLRAAGDEVTVKLYPNVTHITLIGAMVKPLRRLSPVLDDFSSFVLSHGARRGGAPS